MPDVLVDHVQAAGRVRALVFRHVTEWAGRSRRFPPAQPSQDTEKARRTEARHAPFPSLSPKRTT